MSDWEDNHHQWEDRMNPWENGIHDIHDSSITNNLNDLDDERRRNNMIETSINIIDGDNERIMQKKLYDRNDENDEIPNKTPAFFSGESDLIKKPEYQFSPWVSKLIGVVILIFIFAMFFAHYLFGNG